MPFFLVSMVELKKTPHKYGIHVPNILGEAGILDKQNNNRMLQNIIDKEMRNVAVAFEILDHGTKAPPDWSKSSGHIVFDA